MKGKSTRVTFKDALTRKSETDWNRVRNLSDKQIDAAIARDPDAAPAADEAWFSQAELVVPEPKQLISLRVDTDVLRWYRDHGRGWQTQMNAVLRTYAAAHGAKLGAVAVRTRSTPAAKTASRRSDAPKVKATVRAKSARK